MAMRDANIWLKQWLPVGLPTVTLQYDTSRQGEKDKAKSGGKPQLLSVRGGGSPRQTQFSLRRDKFLSVPPHIEWEKSLGPCTLVMRTILPSPQCHPAQQCVPPSAPRHTPH
mmetsp:Transcript_46126/g.115685  ORF Transcript_46126/g.115685 Transcript_46126/m.115685 type:complete len:112 (+) Transcript_46126:86-421(+)